jgi:hypothetical protein
MCAPDPNKTNYYWLQKSEMSLFAQLAAWKVTKKKKTQNLQSDDTKNTRGFQT